MIIIKEKITSEKASKSGSCRGEITKSVKFINEENK